MDKLNLGKLTAQELKLLVQDSYTTLEQYEAKLNSSLVKKVKDICIFVSLTAIATSPVIWGVITFITLVK